MKNFVLNLLSLAVCCCLVACSDGDDDAKSATSQSATMPAEASSQLVTLDKLNEPIESATAQDSWLSVAIVPYTTGAPVVKLSATANPDTKERKTRVVITTSSQEKVNLSVVQKAKAEPSEGGSIEDTYDTVTDQPAYAPVR